MCTLRAYLGICVHEYLKSLEKTFQTIFSLTPQMPESLPFGLGYYYMKRAVVWPALFQTHNRNSSKITESALLFMILLRSANGRNGKRLKSTCGAPVDCLLMYT